MIPSLIIFLCAVIAMVAMISVRLYELERGNQFIFAQFRKDGDKKAREWFLKTKVFIIEQEHRTIMFVKNIPVRILHFVAWLNEYLHTKYGKHIDMIKGRGVVTPGKGQTSVFINAISEYKKDLEHDESAIEKL